VEGGIKLQDLIDDAAKHGLAMSNLGSITWQSIAGALSTGTHGTGIKLGILATFVRELELINAQGQVLRCSAVRCCCSSALPLRPVSIASLFIPADRAARALQRRSLWSRRSGGHLHR
jgi:FAD/FMN-containing dehydrogenase